MATQQTTEWKRRETEIASSLVTGEVFYATAGCKDEFQALGLGPRDDFKVLGTFVALETFNVKEVADRYLKEVGESSIKEDVFIYWLLQQRLVLRLRGEEIRWHITTEYQPESMYLDRSPRSHQL